MLNFHTSVVVVRMLVVVGCFYGSKMKNGSYLLSNRSRARSYILNNCLFFTHVIKSKWQNDKTKNPQTFSICAKFNWKTFLFTNELVQKLSTNTLEIFRNFWKFHLHTLEFNSKLKVVRKFHIEWYFYWRKISREKSRKILSIFREKRKITVKSLENSCWTLLILYLMIVQIMRVLGRIWLLTRFRLNNPQIIKMFFRALNCSFWHTWILSMSHFSLAKLPRKNSQLADFYCFVHWIEKTRDSSR